MHVAMCAERNMEIDMDREKKFVFNFGVIIIKFPWKIDTPMNL